MSMEQEFYGLARVDNASEDTLRQWFDKYNKRASLADRFERVFDEVRKQLAGVYMMVNYTHGKFVREDDNITYPMLAMWISTDTGNKYRCMVGFVTDLHSTEILTINFYGPERFDEILPLVEN